MFLDAITVKVRDGQVTSRPVYVSIGVSLGGERDFLGLWAGDGGEGCVDRRVHPSATGSTASPTRSRRLWDRALVQRCIIPLIRNAFRYASYADWKDCQGPVADLHRPWEAAAAARFDELADKWGGKYPAVIALWRNAWTEFVRFLDFTAEIRRIIGSTQANRSTPATGVRPAPAGTSSPGRPR